MPSPKLFSGFRNVLLISLAGSIGSFNETVRDTVHCRRHDYDIVCLCVAANQRDNILSDWSPPTEVPPNFITTRKRVLRVHLERSWKRSILRSLMC